MWCWQSPKTWGIDPHWLKAFLCASVQTLTLPAHKQHTTSLFLTSLPKLSIVHLLFPELTQGIWPGLPSPSPPPSSHHYSNTNLSRTCDRAHKAHRAPLPLTQLLQALPVFLLHEERVALLILRTPQLQDADGWIAQLEVVSSNQRSCWIHYFLQNISCSMAQE